MGAAVPPTDVPAQCETRLGEGTVGLMTHDPSPPAVLQLRLVVETDEFDAALNFYRDALGLVEQAAFEGDGDARVVILDAGRATLELVNAAQRRMIDQIEVGRDASPRLRVAFEVPDCKTATSQLASAGATLIGGPVVTPWRSLNARFDAPADLQLTLFQELGAEPSDE
jgi:predicted enzyme related to lactoylglutathione lyase